MRDMHTEKFPVGVAERLKWYVYRLIDPRNGETFYVGKGRDDRLFHHAKGALAASNDEDKADLKFQRIKDITTAGLEVTHVIHRHGIDDEKTAFQIEAALIDAYPGLTNRVSGHGAGDYGVRHVVEIIADYGALPFEPKEPLIIDDYSRAIAGFFLSFNSPSALQTALALRQAIWRKSGPTGSSSAFPRFCIPTTAATLLRPTSNRSPPTLRCAWFFRRRGIRGVWSH